MSAGGGLKPAAVLPAVLRSTPAGAMPQFDPLLGYHCAIERGRPIVIRNAKAGGLPVARFAGVE